MRDIKIEDGCIIDINAGKPLECPMGKKPLGEAFCSPTCAWFNIEAGCDCENEHAERKFAYCKDHCIGRLAE